MPAQLTTIPLNLVEPHPNPDERVSYHDADEKDEEHSQADGELSSG